MSSIKQPWSASYSSDSCRIIKATRHHLRTEALFPRLSRSPTHSLTQPPTLTHGPPHHPYSLACCATVPHSCSSLHPQAVHRERSTLLRSRDTTQHGIESVSSCTPRTTPGRDSRGERPTPTAFSATAPVRTASGLFIVGVPRRVASSTAPCAQTSAHPPSPRQLVGLDGSAAQVFFQGPAPAASGGENCGRIWQGCSTE